MCVYHRSIVIVPVWSTIVAVAKLSLFLPTVVGSVILAIFPRIATLSHSLLLLRTSRTDNGSSSSVLISKYCNAYSESCWQRDERHVVDHNFLSVFSECEIPQLNRCPILLAFGKKLPFVFGINYCFLRFRCRGLQRTTCVVHGVLLVPLLGRKMMDITNDVTGSWSFSVLVRCA